MLIKHQTCEGDQVRQAEAIGQDNELHGIQVRSGAEASRVEILQHRLHTTTGRVWEQHLWNRNKTWKKAVYKCKHFYMKITVYTNISVTLFEIFSQRTKGKYISWLIHHFATVMFINVVLEWVTSVKCSIHLFSAALDKRPTKHGCHPITARDE